MSEPWQDDDDDDGGELIDLQDRVADLEECLTEVCEQLARYVERRERTHLSEAGEEATALAMILVATIKRHALGS